MHNIRAIRTEGDYNWALSEIEKYFDNEPEPGTKESDRFDVLADLIEAYEAHFEAED
jgi:HTH-type transcriptional regulator/antitoxin HigA